ncbi:MAG: phosphate propanoyltransferase [Candidatus Sumerlaeaceae bacterium]|nr:phosphate propanoyltransferase [Candidatus Sumerlaeaceae bacterium]
MVDTIVARVLERLASSRGNASSLMPQSDNGLISEDIKAGRVPIGVSARHVHLSREHHAILFGADSQLTVLRPLKQVGEYASEQQVTIVSPVGRCLGPIRVLGPLRSTTQVELSLTDCYGLGLKRLPPIRPSGDHRDTSGITLVGPAGSITIAAGVIRANRHIHMHPSQASVLGLRDRDVVAVRIEGERPAILFDVQVRVAETFRAELHLDTDDANALGVKTGDLAQILRSDRL